MLSLLLPASADDGDGGDRAPFEEKRPLFEGKAFKKRFGKSASEVIGALKVDRKDTRNTLYVHMLSNISHSLMREDTLGLMEKALFYQHLLAHFADVAEKDIEKIIESGDDDAAKAERLETLLEALLEQMDKVVDMGVPLADFLA